MNRKIYLNLPFNFNFKNWSTCFASLGIFSWDVFSVNRRFQRPKLIAEVRRRRKVRITTVAAGELFAGAPQMTMWMGKEREREREYSVSEIVCCGGGRALCRRQQIIIPALFFSVQKAAAAAAAVSNSADSASDSAVVVICGSCAGGRTVTVSAAAETEQPEPISASPFYTAAAVAVMAVAPYSGTAGTLTWQ